MIEANSMLDQPIGRSAAAPAAEFDRACRITFAILVGLTTLVLAMPPIFGDGVTEALAQLLAYRQDAPLILIFLGAALFRPKAAATAESLQNSRLALTASLAFIVIAGWAGHYLVFQNYDLSRDEQMAVFDQGIYAKGAALWPIPQEWRPFADALGRRFMLPIGANEFWVSAYLPVHAGFRALVSLVADPALTSPLSAALSAACTWGIARKLWPDSSNVAVVALILLVTSSQVLIMSMTSFSMSMHLGLNLLWLFLFLKDRWPMHVLAVVVGFFATGIHQPLFHPLFALPFCALLIDQRKWSVAAFYAAAYAAIAAAWMAYPSWVVSHGAALATPINCGLGDNCASGVGFVQRLLATVNGVSAIDIWLTASNLLRFAVWQHPLLLPLMLLGAIGLWKSEPLVKALAVSFALPIVFMAMMLPWQGHGWGYRYLHPVLGNAVLLACYGFHRLQQGGLSIRRPLVVTSALAVALLGVHAWMAAQIVRPFAEVHEQLAASPADILIVDTDEVPFGQDLVVNRADLSNRPKLLIAGLLRPEDIPELCSLGTIAFQDGPSMPGLSVVFDIDAPARPSRAARALHAAAEQAHCRIVR